MVCTVKPVYKGHSGEPENMTFMSSCYIQVKIKCTTLYSLMGKMRLSFIDSDLLCRGALYRQ
jgi:hypothetical protein